jgi:threonine synthase
VSTGSAGLACSAYAARAGLDCAVLVPEGTPEERLIPMQALGARVVAMSGTLSAMDGFVARLKQRPGWFDCTTQRDGNPYQIEAPKTIAYEIAGALGRAPGWVVVPVGGGATLYGIWQGFRDLKALGKIDRLPRLVSVQPKRFNTLEVALQQGLRSREELGSIAMNESVPTVARNLKAGVPSDGDVALEALRSSQGLALSITDDTTLKWQQQLGRAEGIFCEPSSAVAAAAISELVGTAILSAADEVVAIITGSGLREVSSAGPLRLIKLDARADPSVLD